MPLASFVEIGLCWLAEGECAWVFSMRVPARGAVLREVRLPCGCLRG
jgi:hypothetical protein